MTISAPNQVQTAAKPPELMDPIGLQMVGRSPSSVSQRQLVSRAALGLTSRETFTCLTPQRCTFAHCCMTCSTHRVHAGPRMGAGSPFPRWTCLTSGEARGCYPLRLANCSEFLTEI